jgi:hypothetical protein
MLSNAEEIQSDTLEASDRLTILTHAMSRTGEFSSALANVTQTTNTLTELTDRVLRKLAEQSSAFLLSQPSHIFSHCLRIRSDDIASVEIANRMESPVREMNNHSQNPKLKWLLAALQLQFVTTWELRQSDFQETIDSVYEEDLLSVFLHQRDTIIYTLATQTFLFVLHLLAMGLMRKSKRHWDRNRRLALWERNLRGDPAFRNITHLFSDALDVEHMQLELDPEDDLQKRPKGSGLPPLVGINAHMVKGVARLADEVFMYHVVEEIFLEPICPWVIKQCSFLLKGRYIEGETQYSGPVPHSAFAKKLEDLADSYN